MFMVADQFLNSAIYFCTFAICGERRIDHRNSVYVVMADYSSKEGDGGIGIVLGHRPSIYRVDRIQKTSAAYEAH